MPALSSRHVRLGSFLNAFLLAAMAWLASASSAFAQSEASDPSRWGAKVSFIPSWTMADQIKDLLGGDEEGSVLKFDGSEFTIGFVRGSRLGGDWGVSFVRKPFKDGSGETTIEQDCFNQAQTVCRPRTESTLTQNMVLTGVEVHWFMRIVNIKELVQIGLNFGGGIAKTSGNVVTTKTFFRLVNPNANPNQVTNPLVEMTEVETVPAKDELFPLFPQGKVEVVGSVIVAPKFKVQVAYGLNFPAYAPRIMGVVFF